MLAVKKESSCFLADTLPVLINAVIHKQRVTHTFRLLENMVPRLWVLIPPRIGTTLRAGSAGETKETSIIHRGGVTGLACPAIGGSRGD
ncbi:hypothetical protein VZT92_005301 [Zoarces viviparus]|uniref:Uncharacterized protein n=1 Tax=Zoarces viviparus TaxID=48416 RepID=A0AAW1FTT1_ZOAVI